MARLKARGGSRAMRTACGAAWVAVSVVGVGVVVPLAGGCGSETAREATTTEDVIRTTFYPTMWMASRIAGGLVPVECPVPAEADPIFHRPTVEQIARYQRARLIIVNGAEFEKWVSAAPLPRSRVVDSAAGFADEFITIEGTTHSHGPSGEHTHEGTDGHTWLDPRNAIRQAEAIASAMSGAFPEHAGAFASNLAALRADLEGLDGSLTALTPALEGVVLLASHPAYNYVARRYGWSVTNLDLDPEAPLSAEALASVAEAIEDRGVRRVMLWESAPLEETAEALRDRFGIASVVFSPCEMLSEEEIAGGADYLVVMRANIEGLRGAAGGG